MRIYAFVLRLFLMLTITGSLSAQISPGPLSSFHSHLEGISNCTRCHDIGKKVTNAKCLDCHRELKSRIDQQKGYHVSAAVRGKECIVCHNEHHGLKFQLVKFDTEKFDHRQTGYTLSGAHAKMQCRDCHKPEFIADREIRKKKFSYLGLTTACLGCHPDYHQQTLSTSCLDCHGFDAFRPAPGFDHDKAKFALKGRHNDLACDKCHRTGTRAGKKFQEFRGIAFNGCVNCHRDVHQNKFGQRCEQCHSEQSFQTLKRDNNFDHFLTGFALEGKHRQLTCASCHKASYSVPVSHERCADCHQDYHDGQFAREQGAPDCAECHTTGGFPGSTYTIGKHNASLFPLTGAHLATPCNACHKKQENARWSFRNIGMLCRDCHKDIHENLISAKYYPEASCESCHRTDRWSNVSFDHGTTNFALSGVHAVQNCRTCHFPEDGTGHSNQRFASLGTECITCHQDIHQRQFEEEGKTRCDRCHGFEQWKIGHFDHSRTRFRLEGKHAELPCSECHRKVTRDQQSYILYKTNKIQCIDCHS